ncbi:hypothetical protein JCM1840_006740 [Sporobolomyces johnsonii]
MAGGHGGYQPVKLDPGVESWAYMRENVWRFFRFTKTTGRLSLIFGVIIPVGTFVMAQHQDLKWDIAGARRDDPIARWGPKALRPSERAAAAVPAEDDE